MSDPNAITVSKELGKLPDFDAPPLVEVALAVQFRPLNRLRAPLLARWESARRELPIWEEKPPLSAQREVFGLHPASIALRLESDLPTVRAWFLNADRSEILQVQPDALIRNWVKVGDEAYPRYPALRTEFERLFRDFEDFVRREELGEIRPNQCEVTYVNTVDLTDRDVGDVVHAWTGKMSSGFLPAAERSEIVSHYRIEQAGRPVGRLHIDARTVETQGARQLRLSLTARGAPLPSGLPGVLQWFDLGRECIVRGFASYTTPAMHAEWKRRS